MTFAECLDECERFNLDRSILLGNGFSMAWDYETFNYQNLFERVDLDPHQEFLAAIFNAFQTYDFEKVMKVLMDAKKIAVIHGECPDLITASDEQVETLRNSLINVIAENHPENSRQINQQQYQSAFNFLENFDQFFSLNYDLLLYWLANEYRDELGIDDGFRRPSGDLRWCEPDDQNLHFLHGALHLYDEGTAIRKYYQREEINILDSVSGNLTEGIFPLFVSEPTSELKKNKILHNPYLNSCYEALSSVQGAMFIFGVSFNENDIHIFEQISDIPQTQLRKIYVGLYGNRNAPHNREIIGRAISLFGENNHVEFFNSESAQVWG